jgi:hypothetical protein
MTSAMSLPSEGLLSRGSPAFVRSSLPSPKSFWPLALIRLRAGCMMTRINIYLHIPGYSGFSEQPRLMQAQRIAPAMASASRLGFRRAFMATTANLKGLLQKALLGRSKPRLATSSEG